MRSDVGTVAAPSRRAAEDGKFGILVTIARKALSTC